MPGNFASIAELNRIGQLKRFLAPEVAQLVVEDLDASLLESHRRYVASLFCDLRGFTAFSERAEPEEVIDVLQRYHEALGRLVDDSGGTIDHRAGDGLMVIFNDPLPCEEPVQEAITTAFRMNEAVRELCREWTRLGHELGFGIGIAAGYATLGLVGDENRSDYTAIGNVINLSSRLCDKAKDGEILISRRAYLDVEGRVSAEAVGLDTDRLSVDMDSAEIDDMLQRNYELAQALEIGGTPAFVIGDEVVRGAMDMSRMRRLVAGVRAGAS